MLLYIEFCPHHSSLEKLRYFLVQRRFSFHATHRLSPFASMVKKISEYLETLSALFPLVRSAKSAIRGTWTVSLARKLLFRRSADIDYRKIEEKNLRWGEKSRYVQRFVTSNGEYLYGQTWERQNVPSCKNA